MQLILKLRIPLLILYELEVGPLVLSFQLIDFLNDQALVSDGQFFLKSVGDYFQPRLVGLQRLNKILVNIPPFLEPQLIYKFVQSVFIQLKKPPLRDFLLRVFELAVFILGVQLRFFSQESFDERDALVQGGKVSDYGGRFSSLLTILCWWIFLGSYEVFNLGKRLFLKGRNRWRVELLS